jgi:hypothetical protein
LYDPIECFPATKKGEFQLQIVWDVADTGFDGLTYSIESLELPAAQPTGVQKITTQALTFAATGDNDVQLPTGNLYRGILAFGTTGFAGAAPAPTLGRMKLLANNRESYYGNTDFEVARAISSARRRRLTAWNEHLHGFVDGAAGQTDTQRQNDLFPSQENYVLLDLDPTWDDAYSLNTEGLSELKLRVTAETADAARFLPIERLTVERLGLAGGAAA